MTITSQPVGYNGNIVVADGFRISQDTMLNALIVGGVSTHPSWTVGTGAPTFAAAQGSMYSRIDGSTTATRLYINTTGSTTWTNVTTAA